MTWASSRRTSCPWGTETDLNQWGAKFWNPAIFVSLVEWHTGLLWSENGRGAVPRELRSFHRKRQGIERQKRSRNGGCSDPSANG